MHTLVIFKAGHIEDILHCVFQQRHMGLNQSQFFDSSPIWKMVLGDLINKCGMNIIYKQEPSYHTMPYPWSSYFSKITKTSASKMDVICSRAMMPSLAVF
mmetsp:Transcript_36371/g.55594  ORF Transcript_36371/g.55594 Transcript_36371/m.55594 type:complete len:100 (+) Transcript_36371:249-548(+)